MIMKWKLWARFLFLMGVVVILASVGYALHMTRAVALSNIGDTGQGTRLVVFESWLSRGCPYCQEGSKAINQLAGEYAAAGKPVLFLEYSADCYGCYFGREDRLGQSGVDTLLPKTMIDSGQQVSSRPTDYYNRTGTVRTYKTMIESALARTSVPQVAVQAQSRRKPGYLGDDLEFIVTITNTSGIALRGSSSANEAMIHAVVYESPSTNGLTDNVVVYGSGTAYEFISPELGLGETRTFTLTVESLSSFLNWDNLHSLVIVDYCPEGGTGPCDMLQAIEVPGASLAVNMQAAPDPFQPGQPLTYTLQMVNTGGMDLHTTITNTLPAYVTYTGPTLVWTPTLAALGGLWEHTLTVTVTEGYTGALVSKLDVTTAEDVGGVYYLILNGHEIYLPMLIKD